MSEYTQDLSRSNNSSAKRCGKCHLTQSEIEASCDDIFEQLLESIIELCKIDSSESYPEQYAPFGRGCAEALEKALSISERLGFRTENFENMVGVASVGPETDDYIALVGHVDVVPAEGIWKTPPFEPDFREGRIYARGVLDNKGPILSSLFAVYALDRIGYDFPKRVSVIYGTNEETGMRDMIDYFKSHNYPAYGWTPDCKFPVVYAERGRLKLLVSSQTSSNEPLYSFLNNFILNTTNVEQSLGVDFQSEEFGLNQIRKVELKESDQGLYLELIDSYPADIDVNWLVEQIEIRAGKDLKIEITDNIDPVFFEKDSVLVQSLTKGYEMVVGEHEDPVPTTGGTYAKVVRNIVPFGPSFKGQKNIAHLPDEWMNIEDIRKILKIYAVSLWQLCEAI